MFRRDILMQLKTSVAIRLIHTLTDSGYKAGDLKSFAWQAIV